jgi:hypothetical protein
VLEARGITLGQRLHRVEQGIVVDAVVAVRQQPDRGQAQRCRDGLVAGKSHALVE